MRIYKKPGLSGRCAEIISSREDIVEVYRTGLWNDSDARSVELQKTVILSYLKCLTRCHRQRSLSRLPPRWKTKKLPMVTDIRDESDHEDPVRIVITLTSNRVDREVLMLHLFATTDLGAHLPCESQYDRFGP